MLFAVLFESIAVSWIYGIDVSLWRDVVVPFKNFYLR